MKAKEILELEAKNGAFSHAYLFVGDSFLASALVEFIIHEKKCLPENVIRVKPEEKSGKAGEIGIEQIREVFHQINRTSENNSKIVVIYDGEKLNQSSSNILLKSLEEPPADTIFIIVAKSDTVLATIKSRCRSIYIFGQYGFSGELKIEQFKNGFFEASEAIDLIIKENTIDNLLNQLQAHLREKLLAEKKLETVKAIWQIEETRDEIAKNANPKLSLESLYLLIKDQI